MNTPTAEEIKRLMNYEITDAEAEHLAKAPQAMRDGTASQAQVDFLRDAGVLED